MHRLFRYYHTLRYLRPWQIAGRLAAPVKRRLIRLPPPPRRLQGDLSARVPFVVHDPWNTRGDVRAGRFRFLGVSHDLGRPVDWVAADAPLLWRFNLHYFHYLHLLQTEEQEALCGEWVDANPVGETVGWHPYPLSLRIVNWCKAGVREPALLQSLYGQAAWLYRTLETYHPGNHLLENARALIFAGRFFLGQGEAQKWVRRGVQIYRNETPTQVLPDGGYFERSPMYHALMLEGYLDLLNILPPPYRDAAWLRDTAARMADFLISLVHPDGTLALFNDTTHEVAAPVETLGAYAQKVLDRSIQIRPAFPDSGYFVHRSEDCYLVIDAGPIGPDYLPAHAHADLFSYELSVGRRPLVVDSGVFEYTAGSMRDYVRSTRAHNTVCIDGQSQAECWASFRVARRFQPEDVSFERTTAGSQFSGTFSGYRHLIGDGIVHHRRIAVDEYARTITVADQVGGSGEHLVESCIHLHPDVTVLREGRHFILEQPGRQCKVQVNRAPVAVEEGWYCPAFGRRERNKVLVIGSRAALPQNYTYTIHY